MKHYPDKFFDLAVVDPPYGINMAESLANGWASRSGGVKHKAKDWDKEPPPLEYFYELFRVTKNQIIWGANHFISRMPYDASCWIFWDKNNGDSLFADGEMAWTSFDKPVRMVKVHWCGSAAKHEGGTNKIHPTQKPIKLYDWIFQKFAKHGQRVLDTHLGSQSSRIAAHKNGLDFYGAEIDKEYFEIGGKRYEEFTKQGNLFQMPDEGGQEKQSQKNNTLFDAP